MITQTELKRMFKYDPETGVVTRKIDAGRWGRSKTGTVVGTDDGQGYLRVCIDRKYYRLHRLIWKMVYGYDPPQDTHHKNDIRSDNRLSNIVSKTKSSHVKERELLSNNTSGVTGVYWHSQAEKWGARIEHFKKRHSLGLHASFDDAVLTRWKAEQKYLFPKNTPAFKYLKDKELI